jgi:hypothetical protein
MMMLFATTTGLVATVIVLTAGYMLGARRGAEVRERLWRESLDIVDSYRRERADLLEQRSALQPVEPGPEIGKLLELVLRQGEALQRLLEPLTSRISAESDLRAAIEHVLTPLARRERLIVALADVETGTGHQGDLSRLLDRIAEKGQFRAVVLSDDAGLPLAASSNAWDVERLSAIGSLLLMSADRIGREGAPAPLSLMVHDEENNVTLCRLFRVRGRRLVLIAVATGVELTTTALDPALTMVDNILSK